MIEFRPNPLGGNPKYVTLSTESVDGSVRVATVVRRAAKGTWDTRALAPVSRTPSGRRRRGPGDVHYITPVTDGVVWGVTSWPVTTGALPSAVVTDGETGIASTRDGVLKWVGERLPAVEVGTVHVVVETSPEMTATLRPAIKWYGLEGVTTATKRQRTERTDGGARRVITTRTIRGDAIAITAVRQLLDGYDNFPGIKITWVTGMSDPTTRETR